MASTLELAVRAVTGEQLQQVEMRMGALEVGLAAPGATCGGEHVEDQASAFVGGGGVEGASDCSTGGGAGGFERGT